MRTSIAIVIVSGLFACEPERPPAPTPAGPVAVLAPESATFRPKETPAVLTYAGAKGEFADTSKVDVVPEASAGLVRVKLLDGPEAPESQVWVANLRRPQADGSFALSAVPRDMFEELALGQGLSSEVKLPEGLEPPAALPPSEGIVVYKTSWCGVCKQVEAYLTRKGIPYVAKDIEADPAAAAELRAKADQAGVRTGSVPVIDVRGQLIVGFDRARLEKLLASATPGQPT